MARRRALSARGFAILAVSWLALPALELALRRRGLASLRQWRPRPRPTAAGIDAGSLARLVETAARLQPLPARCLAQSLWLEWLLAREDIPCMLRLGARRTAAGLEAHAWVEHAGQPLNDTADVAHRFAAFPDLPAANRRQSR